MSLPDRTLCWAEGPPWDRSCVPVELDVDVIYRRLNGWGAETTHDQIKAVLYAAGLDFGRPTQGERL